MSGLLRPLGSLATELATEFWGAWTGLGETLLHRKVMQAVDLQGD
jgi:hypothetical protein